MRKLHVKPKQCTLYVDVNKVKHEESVVVDELAEHCTLSFAIRRQEAYDAQQAVRLQRYDYIMPTVEYHPSHPNYASTIGINALRVVQQSVPKAIYWIVDTPQDLERVALLRGYGIVSNRPLEMVKLVQDTRVWCLPSH
ncbi:expressed unknown protein [Seminavis robusta]|uniref:Uncharacterized protein n=1 Tax=Seminavis robusta TaxID=568900 RepID=A0A9N8ETJ3_9STRA|nr:expressed unknown protein [Seminavis robusta]|eukprot:Sro2098_g314430.1 n/a (139) ;mRNA; r:17848-18264